MPTDEERREVAARLRNYENLRESFRESPICAFIDALWVGYLDWEGVCNRLADLIEPEPERTCHMTCVKRGPFCTAWEFDCCGFEFVENDAAFGQTYLPGTVCPNCGAKVVEQ